MAVRTISPSLQFWQNKYSKNFGASMDRYYTVMIIPEKEKGVRSIRIPRLLFRSIAFIVSMMFILLVVLGYDYWQILQQVYANKHLTIENRQLKEQIQLFQMKMNSLSDDIQRIHTFERKLRVITGLDQLKDEEGLQLLKKANDKDLPKEIGDETSQYNTDKSKQSPAIVGNELFDLKLNLDIEEIEKEKDFIELKDLYEKKIAEAFGLGTTYNYAKEWSELTKISLGLSNQYARFDYQFNKIRKIINELETNVHTMDQSLLDKETFLNSTPSLLPANGWITSYFGPRFSPYSGALKMHEGMDIGARPGTNIFSPADGVITFAGEKSGFGKFVQIDHGYGMETIFGHASAVLVRTGQRIKRGDLIARVGNTGRSTGPHLHYEVRVNGTAVDPLYFVLN